MLAQILASQWSIVVLGAIAVIVAIRLGKVLIAVAAACFALAWLLGVHGQLAGLLDLLR